MGTTAPKPTWIGLAGPSCAGKGTIAAALATVAPAPCLHLCLDHFYLDQTEMRRRFGGSPNWDHPLSLDWPLLLRTLAELEQGRPVAIPEYDFASHSRLPKSRTALPAPIVLLDGLWLAHEPTVLGRLDLLVFIDLPAEIALARRVERDTRSRGRSVAEIERQFHTQVEPMRQQFVAPQKQIAGLVLNGTLAPDKLASELADAIAHLRGGNSGATSQRTGEASQSR